MEVLRLRQSDRDVTHRAPGLIGERKCVNAIFKHSPREPSRSPQLRNC